MNRSFTKSKRSRQFILNSELNEDVLRAGLPLEDVDNVLEGCLRVKLDFVDLKLLPLYHFVVQHVIYEVE